MVGLGFQTVLFQKVLRWCRHLRKLFLVRWIHWRRALGWLPLPAQEGILTVSLRFIDSHLPLAARCAMVSTLVRTFEDLGYTVHVWLRGPNIRQTRLFHHLSTQEGLSEEVFLLSQTAPLWVCRFPENAFPAAHHAGATAILLVDPREETLHRSHLVMVAADKEFQLAKASKKSLHFLARSDAFVIVDATSAQVASLRQQYPATYAASWTLKPPIEASTPVIAFTGLQDAGAFYHVLLEHFVHVEGFVPVNYRKDRKERTLHALSQTAARQGFRLVTTSRDMYFLSVKMGYNVVSLSLELALEPEFVQSMREQGLVDLPTEEAPLAVSPSVLA